MRVGLGDLAFDEIEIAGLLEAASLPSGDGQRLATELLRLTDGWPVAVQLALAQRSSHLVDPVDGPPALDRVMATLIDRLLATLDADERAAVTRLGAVPLLSRAVAGALGDERAVEVADAIGLPLVRRADGWLSLPDPVRDALAVPVLPVEMGRAVAAEYGRAGELHAAVQLLHAHDDVDGLADLVAARPWRQLEAAGVSFARVVAGMLGDGETAAVVDALIALARAVETDDPALRRTLLARADAATVATGDARRRAVVAELAGDAWRRGDVDAADELAGAVLAEASPRELETRARALYARAVADTIRCTPPALARARDEFGESAALAELCGRYRWAADALLRTGYAVSFHGGAVDEAIAPIERALALAPAADRSRAVVLTYLADVLDSAGRMTDAEAACREALGIGERLRDQRVIGYACWASVWLAAHQGDHAGTVAWLDEAVRHRGPWLDEANGAEFYLAAADMLLSLGDEPGGASYLATARARTEAFGLDDAYAPALARYEACFGDPVRAEELLAELEGRPFAVARLRWTRALLRGYAAHRRGDDAGARRFRAAAAEHAAECGHPDLPMRHERWLDAHLRRYDERAENEPAGATELRLLGSFAVHAGGLECTPPHGHPAALVKLLALGGALTADQLIDELWPECDAATGRSRLRNTLNRLKARSGDIVVRNGDALELASDVVVDVAGFESAAEEALAAPAAARAGLARRAVALYRGELLPGDRYANWAAAPRERLRRRYLTLVDLLAADAEARGDLDEAVRQLDAGMAIEPLDDLRPARAARLLLSQGRRASARDVLRHALAVVDELGVSPGDELSQVLDELGYADGVRADASRHTSAATSSPSRTATTSPVDTSSRWPTS